MSYRQFTQCVDPKKHGGSKALYLAGGGLLGVTAALAILAAGGGLLPGVAIAALLIVIRYCDWWLTDRLICLGGERCAIGLLLTVERPEDKSGFNAFDTDYSINLLLAPHIVGDSRTEIENDGMQGDLIKEQDATANEKDILGAKIFPFTGSTVKAAPDTALVISNQHALHGEFEGGGVFKLREAAEAALPFATAAAVACSIPILGTLACVILAVIAAVISLAGIATALADKGSPTDVSPDLKELHSRSDILFMRGEWVLDSGHSGEGWNEIHPIRDCLRIAEWDPTRSNQERGVWDDLLKDWKKSRAMPPGKDANDWQKWIDQKPTPDDWKAWVESYCVASVSAASLQTQAAQAKLENRWTIHPAIDGCAQSGDGGEPQPSHVQ